MENKDEIKALIGAFKEYRDLLTPIEQNLQDFSSTYENMRQDIDKLNNSFGGDIQGKLDGIYKELSRQFERSKDLSSQIENFIQKTNKYAFEIDRVSNFLNGIEEKIKNVDEIEKKAEEQIARLNYIIEEKKKSYNIKELQKNLDTYNTNVQKISDYINNDVAKALQNNNQTIEIIKDKNESVLAVLQSEKSSIESLIAEYKSSNQFLKNLVEKEDVNEQYLFEILDKWAMERGVKTKK